jgi:hypothetical protein
MQFTESKFLTFLYHYLLTIRMKMWAKSSMESQGLYAFSCQLIGLLRMIYEQSGTEEEHPWRQQMGGLLNQFVNSLHKLNRPREIEVLLSLFRGCDFEGLAPGSLVYKENKSE